MTMIEKPMLAAVATPENLEKIKWPVLASPKIDGIRCLIHPTLGPVTRSFKPLPNEFVRETLLKIAARSDLDGELVAVNEDGTDKTFNETQSAMMSRDGQPEFLFVVFDCFTEPTLDYASRLNNAYDSARLIGRPEITVLQHTIINGVEEFARFANICVASGFEGAMIRHTQGPYKSGRSTFNQGWLLKYKNWADAEGIVVGFEELYHNSNPDLRNNFDQAKRSSHKSGMIPMGMLGALVIQTEWGELRLGTGFDMATRKEIWGRNTRSTDWLYTDIGRKVTFKYQEFGMQSLPRFPVFKCFRDDDS